MKSLRYTPHVRVHLESISLWFQVGFPPAILLRSQLSDIIIHLNCIHIQIKTFNGSEVYMFNPMAIRIHWIDSSSVLMSLRFQKWWIEATRICIIGSSQPLYVCLVHLPSLSKYFLLTPCLKQYQSPTSSVPP